MTDQNPDVVSSDQTSEAQLSLDPRRFFEALDRTYRLAGLRINFRSGGSNERHFSMQGVFPDGDTFTLTQRWTVTAAGPQAWRLTMIERIAATSPSPANAAIMQRRAESTSTRAQSVADRCAAAAKLTNSATRRLTAVWDQPVAVVLELQPDVDSSNVDDRKAAFERDVSVVKQAVENTGGTIVRSEWLARTLKVELTARQTPEVLALSQVARIYAGRQAQLD